MDVIDRHVKKIDKVVDLFSRIKALIRLKRSLQSYLPAAS